MAFKDFFYESDDSLKEPVKQTTPAKPPVYGDQGVSSFLQQHAQPQQTQNASFLNTPTNAMFNPGPPVVTVPEQRHTDHIADILLKTNAGRQDFFSFMKIVKKMSVATSGAALWTNAFAAFSAINDNASFQGLIDSAQEYETALIDDANAAKQRHDGKFSDNTSDIGTLTIAQTTLQTSIQSLEDSLTAKREQLQQTNTDLQTAINKATSSFASYSIATASAEQEIQLFKQNITVYLTPKIVQQ